MKNRLLVAFYGYTVAPIPNMLQEEQERGNFDGEVSQILKRMDMDPDGQTTSKAVILFKHHH